MGMRERWQMYAVTREAFVVSAARHLKNDGLRELSSRCLSIPGTEGAGIDIESCRTLLDKDFADRVIDEAIAIYTRDNPKLTEEKPKKKEFGTWYECSVHGENSDCHESDCKNWQKFIAPNDGWCYICCEKLLYASDTKAWYCSEGCDP